MAKKSGNLDKHTRKAQTEVERAHGALGAARDSMAKAEARVARAEKQVEKALRKAAAELENRLLYAADGANESTSSEVNLATAALAAIAPPRPRTSRRTRKPPAAGRAATRTPDAGKRPSTTRRGKST